MMRHNLARRLSVLVRRLLRHPHRAASLRGSAGDDVMWQNMVRYLSRETAPADAKRIEAAYAAHPEVERVRRGLMRVTALSREVRTAYRRQAAWDQLVQRIETSERGTQRVRPLFIGPAAPRPAHLTRRGALPAMAVAAMLLLSVAVQQYGGLKIPQWSHHRTPREYVASRGERMKVELPDGSSVTLGPESRLRVTDGSFNFARSREVHLDGIARFAIAHDGAHPFVVYAGGAAVQAVGTAFMVRAYPEDAAAEVVVTSGHVLLRSANAPDGSGTVLVPGDLGRRIAGGVISVTHRVDVERYAGWLDGHLVYDRTPARDVARDLARWYDLRIQIDDTALADTPVNGFFESTRSSEDALRLLASVLGATYEQHGDTAVLRRR